MRYSDHDMKSSEIGLTNGRVWERITALARQNAKKSFVAVAYFGANGADLLPLSKGSWLAVDASEAAVKSGQTCPTALIKLQRNGVRIFSVNHLHAKLFVFGRIGIVGSANASANSANLLIESTITFTSSRDVNTAIRFIRDECCLLELEPERLAQLGKLYRPPLSAGISSNKRLNPTLRIAQLRYVDDYESDPAFERGKRNAAKKFSRDSDFESFSFQWTGACPIKVGDKKSRYLRRAQIDTWSTLRRASFTLNGSTRLVDKGHSSICKADKDGELSWSTCVSASVAGLERSFQEAAGSQQGPFLTSCFAYFEIRLLDRLCFWSVGLASCLSNNRAEQLFAHTAF